MTETLQPTGCSPNGTTILKFFLHISKDEQKKRLEERLQNPGKKWKFSIADVKERKFFDDYMSAFSKMIQKTNTKCAPWIVVPADKKWYRNYLVAEHILEALKKMNMKYPKVTTKHIHVN